jgi:catechol 2,3-dioxygenase-like lactoylglutathione lyase family enzyme
MATIRHIAIFSDNPEKLAEFYASVYGMKITGRSKGDVWITDGYMDVALIMRKQEKSPRGIHHFGFTLEEGEKAPVYEKMKALGKDPFDPRRDNLNVDRPFVEDAAYDPDGNRFDLSTGKREMDAEKARMDEYRKSAKPAKESIE